MPVARPMKLTWNATPNADDSLSITGTVADNTGVLLVSETTTLPPGFTLANIGEWLRGVLLTAIHANLTPSDLGLSGSVTYDFPSAIGATVPLDILL